MTRLEAWPVEGIGEVRPGDDLGALLVDLELVDGDVVLVTSKIAAKAEGRLRAGDREDAIRAQTVRVVARRGPTSIVENPLGLVMAAAGVDASNVAPGTVVLLPEDPDATARTLRSRVYAETARNVAVVVTDTAGRAWRTGQTDLAVGAAGLEPLDDHAGRTDPYGNPLAVTAPAVVDELASVAELVTGKLAGRPVAVVRGLAERVLPPGEHGPGARVLVRPRREDMFALGSREAVVAAVRGEDVDCFGDPASPAELAGVLASCGLEAEVSGRGVRVLTAREGSGRALALERLRLLLQAHGWGGVPLEVGGDGVVTASPPAP